MIFSSNRVRAIGAKAPEAVDTRARRKDERIERLEKLVAALGQAASGRRLENSDPDRFELALEDLETAMVVIHAEEDTEDRAAKRPVRPRAANRGAWPGHLPRIEAIIEPDSPTCAWRRAERVLRGFGGLPQVDGHAGHNRPVAADRIRPGLDLAHCRAHARRRPIEITRTGPAPVAEEGVALIRDLHAIALNRKTAPFADHAVRAENRAAVASLVEPCKTNRVDPQAGQRPRSPPPSKTTKQSQIDNPIP